MLTQGEDVEAHALKERGWSISAIARHLERDRKTVRSYLNGDRQPGVRVTAVARSAGRRSRSTSGPGSSMTRICGRRRCSTRSSRSATRAVYPTFVRQLRQRGLRPHCEACRGVKGRDTIEIEHPPGEEIQWDWFERRRAPWGGTAYVLLGTLPHSSRTRGVLAESLDQAHLIEAMDAVMRRLGGTARVWRTDRLATVIVPGTRDVQPSFAPVAKHYGAIVEPCPPRRGNRKGAVEVSGALHVRTVVADDDRDHTARRRSCRWTASWPAPGDARERRTATGVRTTVGALGDAEPLLALPAAAFPATIEVARVVAANATVAFRGNRYAVPPGLADASVQLRHRLGSATVEIHSPAGCAAGRRIGSRRRAREASCAAPSSTPRSSGSCCPRSPRTGPVTAKRTGRPAPRRSPRPPGCSATKAAPWSSTSPPTPSLVEGGVMSDNSTYQQLRGHLAYLRLAAAAEALPGELDHAAKAKLGHTAFLERLLDVEVAATEARRHAGLDPVRVAARALAARRLRLRRPTLRRPRARQRARPPCGSSRTPPTCCSSARPASARPCSPSVSATPPSTPATAPTTPPPPTSPPAATAPRSKDAGRPPCGSSPGRGC